MQRFTSRISLGRRPKTQRPGSRTSHHAALRPWVNQSTRPSNGLPASATINSQQRTPFRTQRRLMYSPRAMASSNDNSDPHDFWVKRIAAGDLGKGEDHSNVIPFSVGDIAYCNVKCTEERWVSFIAELKRLALVQWVISAEDGVDPHEVRHHWGMYCVFVDGSSLESLEELRAMFLKTIDGWLGMGTFHWQPSTNNFFFIDENVIDSILQGPSKGELPFNRAIDGRYGPDLEEDFYEEHYKIWVEQLGYFWLSVGSGCDSMENSRPYEADPGGIKTDGW